MHMPTPTPVALHPLRSDGPRPLTDDARGAFDPVHQAWIDADRADDIDPDSGDPLRAAPDALARRGLMLRPWSRVDVPAFRAILDDPVVWTHLPDPMPRPLDDLAAARLIGLANGLDSHVVRAVVCDGVPVGQVRLDFGIGNAGEVAEISYWLGRAHWGQGFGRALVAATARRAFARLPGLLRLVAKVHPANPASARILGRGGFRPCPAPVAAFAGWQWFALRRQELRG
jgi:RimJ/RimL family protein N-acetyltransferase